MNINENHNALVEDLEDLIVHPKKGCTGYSVLSSSGPVTAHKILAIITKLKVDDVKEKTSITTPKKSTVNIILLKIRSNKKACRQVLLKKTGISNSALDNALLFLIESNRITKRYAGRDAHRDIYLYSAVSTRNKKTVNQ